MIFDQTLLFSSAQAITADAPSTNILDLGATGTVYGAAAALSRDVGRSDDVALLVQIVENFNNLTSMDIVIQTDDNVGFSSPRDVLRQTLTLAQLTAGRTSGIIRLPPGVSERYLRIYYDITGTAPTTGKVTAGIVAAVQTAAVNF